nr:tetratricopeptide repeat protein [Streptomyces sp. TLI_235]
MHGDLVENVDEFDSASKRVGTGPAGGPAFEGSETDPGAGPRAVTGATGRVLKPLAPPPALPPGFTGREENLEELLGFLAPADSGAGTDAGAGVGGSEHAVVVASVLGMGGMGKTTLALAAGHAALQRGLFTGVLFVDLHGYDDTPTDAVHALDTALRALDADPEQIPPDTDQRAALYRSQLAARARHGERVLVLADNASSSDQVEYLLPSGDGPHRMLVTSRDNLAPDLGARLVDLDVLSPERAVALMDAALRITRPGDGRIAADLDGAARVAELCGYLPLALRIATAQLGRNLKPAQLARDLEDLAERLDVLKGRHAAVRTVLAGSYRRLAPTHAELFRLLAVNPGPDVSTETAVAFTGIGIGKPRDVRARLEALADASLIRQDPDTGRWRMHDLVRAYATEQAELSPHHSAKAQQRLFGYYIRTSRAAVVHLNPVAGGDKKRFPDRGAAMAWFDAERANLVAAVHTAHAAGHREITVDLAALVGDYLRSRRYLQDDLAVAALAHDAAISLGDRHDVGQAWNNLGNAMQGLRRFDDALDAYQHALDIYRELGDRHSVGLAWNNLGNAMQGLRRFDDALDACQHALDIYRELGDRYAEGMAWNHSGLALTELRRFDDALDAYQHALDIYRELGDRHSEGMAWNNLGTAWRGTEAYEQAVEAGERAVAVFRELDDAYREGQALDELADTLRAAGRPAGEVRAVREASAAAYRAVGASAEAEEVLGKADE